MSGSFVSNFQAINNVTLVLGLKTAPKVWLKKRSHSKTAQVRQQIFHMVICFDTRFHPYQPTFSRDEFFCFFFFAFSS